jgi:hypothetical protein
LGATSAGPPEPLLCSSAEFHGDVWFLFANNTMPCVQTVTVSLCGSEFDTQLAVYAGSISCPQGAALASYCNDNACGSQSRVSFQALPGTAYLIRVGGAAPGEEGSGIISLTCGLLPDCPADTNGDGVVDVNDLIAVALGWGTDGSQNNSDLDDDGVVGVDDLLLVITGWGVCD